MHHVRIAVLGISPTSGRDAASPGDLLPAWRLITSQVGRQPVSNLSRPTSNADGADSSKAKDCPSPPGPIDTCAFVRQRGLDSFQKLRLVLWLGRNPGRAFSCAQLGAALHLSDQRLMDELVDELCEAGVVRCRDNLLTLADLPELRRCLDCLLVRFEDPLARQELLAHIGQRQAGYYGPPHVGSSAG